MSLDQTAMLQINQVQSLVEELLNVVDGADAKVIIGACSTVLTLAIAAEADGDKEAGLRLYDQHMAAMREWLIDRIDAT